MKAVGFGERLAQITRYPWLFPVSVYLVREDDGFTLIDTGLSGSEQEILEVAGRYGGRVRRIVLTHADHNGSLDALREALPEAEVLMTAREARFLGGELVLEQGAWRVARLLGYCEDEAYAQARCGGRDRVARGRGLAGSYAGARVLPGRQGPDAHRRRRLPDAGRYCGIRHRQATLPLPGSRHLAPADRARERAGAAGSRAFALGGGTRPGPRRSVTGHRPGHRGRRAQGGGPFAAGRSRCRLGRG
jgi:hypothetical protein